MNRAVLAAVVVAAGVLAFPGTATADVGCEPRSAAHVAEHGGLIADSAWHVEHGQRPTCGDDESHHDDSRKRDDEGVVPRRDHLGFHCTWHGCG